MIRREQKMATHHVPHESLRLHRETARAAFAPLRAVVLAASGLPVPIAGTDGHHDFHVHADHYWLAGADAPGQVLAFDPGEGYTLFVHVPGAEERVWEGGGEGPDAWAARAGLDRVLPRRELAAWLADRAGLPVAVVGNDDLLRQPGAYGAPAGLAADPGLSARAAAALTAARRVKDRGEIALMRAAAAATAAGHDRGMRAARSGMTEHELRVEIDAGFFLAGARRTAYPTIVGAGPAAAVLHYAPGDRRLAEGDLVLVDAGAEVGGYMCDVTRTFPVSPRFGPEQRDLYDLVLAAQESAVSKVRPGKEYREIHMECCLDLARGLVDLGILRGDPSSLVERDAHALFFPHGVGHMLGLATHDVGGYAEGRERSDRFGLKWLRTDLPLAAGHVVTIEPGIYFIRVLLTDPVRRETYRDAVDWEKVDGMLDFGGIRIEDDVHATPTGPEVLTAAVPKRAEEIEALRAERG